MGESEKLSEHVFGSLVTERTWEEILGGMLSTGAHSLTVLKDPAHPRLHAVQLLANNMPLGHFARGEHYLDLLAEYFSLPAIKQATALGLLPNYPVLPLAINKYPALDRWLDNERDYPTRGLEFAFKDGEFLVSLCKDLYSCTTPRRIVSVRSEQWQWAHECLGGELNELVDRIGSLRLRPQELRPGKLSPRAKIIISINPSVDETFPSKARVVYAHPHYRKYL